ncbi:thioredoxin family protein [Microbacterium capsulatum]|uniref:Thioredoxin family protein n=1 Tax=Microbacterium capsulatum TaxID=3041921 RepID=A0ABU0XCK3_9MICO|nr:thioredoxin family protein [Microbacterium sp. ASV81]MDQ4212434.1 thioredoxin family protein [Microbacterium sp. ASV81]
MTLPIALVAAAALLAVTILAGVLLRRRDGRGVAVAGDLHVDPADLPTALGARATLVQFSTEFCARCPHVRRLLGHIAAERPGVVHADVDLTHRADLASRYRVLSTPTTLLVDPDGRIRSRFTGVPTRAAVLAALDGADHTYAQEDRS